MRLPRLASLLVVLALLVAPGRLLGAQPLGPVREAVGALLRTAATQVIDATRAAAPGLSERLEQLLEKRRQAATVPQSAGRRTAVAVGQVFGVSTIGLIVALLVLVTALGPMEGVIRTVEADVSGAFWRGLGAQAVVLPALGLVLLALTLTVVGILLVPVVLLASTVGIAGVGTLGGLSVAAVIGRARGGSAEAKSRARLLRALITGYLTVWLPWLLAALLVAVPVVGVTTRLVALASSWVVLTVGIGAVLRSRGGRRVPEFAGAVRTAIAPAAMPDWSTPTPVAGVVAARRSVTERLAP
jgi:hypothetical protein